MPVPDTSGVPPFADFEMLKNKINELVQKYNNLLVNLDSLNVVSISAGTVIVYDLDGGPGTITITKDGMTINNGAFNTFSVDIDGNVTMTSALIQSALGYPKVELNSAQNLIGAYADSDTYAAFLPTFNAVPTLVLVDGGTTKGALNRSAGGTSLSTFDGEALNFQSSGALNLQSTAAINLNPAGPLQINGANGFTGNIPVVTSVNFANSTFTTRTLTFTKGILTNA